MLPASSSSSSSQQQQQQQQHREVARAGHQVQLRVSTKSATSCASGLRPDITHCMRRPSSHSKYFKLNGLLESVPFALQLPQLIVCLYRSSHAQQKLTLQTVVLVACSDPTADLPGIRQGVQLQGGDG
jgi:hypothetical protein